MGVLTFRNPQPARSGPRSFASGRAICALILREMATRYGRSPGGYLWAVVEPVGALFIMASLFSLLLRSPSLGSSFLLFYATGYLPFLLYSLVQGHVMQALAFSRPLMVYPAVSWIDAIAARFVLNTLTGVAVIGIVLSGILLFTDATAILDFGPLLLATALAALLGLGLGTLNCLLAGLFPAWAQIWSIANRPLLIAAGVFFVMEDLPGWVQGWLWWTPWIHITGLFRAGLYASYQPGGLSVALVLIWALVPLMLGLLLLRRYRQDILMR